MKKLVFVLMFGLCLIGCKQNDSQKGSSPGSQQIDAEQGKDKMEQKMVDFKKLLEKGDFLTLASIMARDADSVLVIDMRKISDPNWVNDNHKYFADPTPADPNPTCVHEKKYFSIERFILEEKDVTQEELAKWLKKNGHAICYPESENFIEDVHKVYDKRARQALNSRAHLILGSVKFSDIQAKLATLQITNLSTEYYRHYIKLTLIGGGKVQIDIEDNYNPYTGGYYSIPLLNKIVKEYGGTTGNVTFNFIEATLYHSGVSTFMYVTDPTIRNPTFANQYYDFSQMPTSLPQGRGYYYLFSPI